MRSTADTREALVLAIKRIQKGMSRIVPVGCKLSIAAVAKEASISHSTVHNCYPDIAEKIRKLARAGNVAPLEAEQSALRDCQRKLAQARWQNEQLQADLAKSQSINLRLVKENELLCFQANKLHVGIDVKRNSKLD